MRDSDIFWNTLISELFHIQKYSDWHIFRGIRWRIQMKSEVLATIFLCIFFLFLTQFLSPKFHTNVAYYWKLNSLELFLLGARIHLFLFEENLILKPVTQWGSA